MGRITPGITPGITTGSCRRSIVGVMGPGEQARPEDCDRAYELGQRIATAGWILLTGGRDVGVMRSASQGAKAAGGLTIGILPGTDPQSASPWVDIAICTGLGQGRNNVNVLSSQVIVACGLGPGTASEIALAIKNQKPVVLLGFNDLSKQFFQQLNPAGVHAANSVEEGVAIVQHLLFRANE